MQSCILSLDSERGDAGLLTTKTKATAPPPQNCQYRHPCEVKSVCRLWSLCGRGEGGFWITTLHPSFIGPIIIILIHWWNRLLPSFLKNVNYPSFMKGSIAAIHLSLKRPITVIPLSLKRPITVIQGFWITTLHPSFIGPIIIILIHWWNRLLPSFFKNVTYPYHPFLHSWKDRSLLSFFHSRDQSLSSFFHSWNVPIPAILLSFMTRTNLFHPSLIHGGYSSRPSFFQSRYVPISAILLSVKIRTNPGNPSFIHSTYQSLSSFFHSWYVLITVIPLPFLERTCLCVPSFIHNRIDLVAILVQYVIEPFPAFRPSFIYGAILCHSSIVRGIQIHSWLYFPWNHYQPFNFQLVTFNWPIPAIFRQFTRPTSVLISFFLKPFFHTMAPIPWFIKLLDKSFF